MEKELKELNRLYRKAKDENVKERLAALIDEIDVDEEPKKEEEVVEEKVEKEKEKPKEEATPKEQTWDIEQIKKQLGLDKYESVIVEQNKKLQEQEEALKKLQDRGYRSNVTIDEEEQSIDDIFANLKGLKPQTK